MAPGLESTPLTSPPPPPSPSQDAGLIPNITSPIAQDQIPSPPLYTSSWDANTIQPETAMKMLCRSVQALANVTGDIPPNPPLSRPRTPRRDSLSDQQQQLQESDSPSGDNSNKATPTRHHRRTPSRPGTPVPSHDLRHPNFQPIHVGAPEAQSDEPSTADIGAGAEPIYLQQIAIARKFFSKKPPTVSLEDYLGRLQRYCPMSTAVYLAAGAYIHKLVVEDQLVPATSRTIHRLVLASLRVAMKALEDLRYPQDRFAGVGGVGEEELRLLEISLCYLTNFELQVTADVLVRRMGGLLQAAALATAQASSAATKTEMNLRLPMRAKTNVSS